MLRFYDTSSHCFLLYPPNTVQDMMSILSRKSLCIPCDSLLLDFIIKWANRKSTYNQNNVINLLQNLKLERKFIQKKTDKHLPETGIASKLVLWNRRIRDCARFYYLVEFKLHKSQLRNIEDFVDKGEKSNFYCFSFPDGNYSKVTTLSSNGSLAGTCNANYFRPITQVI